LISGLVVSVSTWPPRDAQIEHDLVQNQVIALLAGGDLDGCPDGPSSTLLGWCEGGGEAAGG
jgi:hypothetical protein